MPDPAVDQAFALALQNQRAGRLQEAAALYRQVLDRQPAHAGAWHCLGILAHQTGDHDRAIAWIEQAISLQPGDALAYSNLGEAYRAAGRQKEALAACRHALALQPRLAEAHHHLGSVLRDRGQWDEATDSYRRALQIRAEFPEAWSDLGSAYAARDRFPEAVDAYRESLRSRPRSPETLNNLGLALRKTGRGEEAIAAYREALRLRPEYPKALYNLGNALKEADAFDEAAAFYLRALELAPRWHDAHLNLGVTRLQQHSFAEAEAEFRRAIEIEPDSADAHVNLATLLLLLGRDEEGWNEYEWRNCTSVARSFAVPRWDGVTAAGTTILVHAEQGFGDTLQFVRYLPLLAEQAPGARILLECPRALVPLLQQFQGGALEVIASGLEAPSQPAFDFQIPLLSLPRALRRFEPLPMPAPYLRADTERRAQWKSRLSSGAAFKVGVAWAGNPAHPNDARRSIDPGELSALWTIEDVTFVSLRAGPDNPLAPLPPEAGVLDFASAIRDFAEFAALIAELDLIITVDTAAAHLAGALGIPVWVLLPFTPDWRWHIEGVETPWYPTMRLFRQNTPGHWKTVVTEVAAALPCFREARLPVSRSSETEPSGRA
jgi:tetratricopeptide (TPR) repeat protein